MTLVPEPLWPGGPESASPEPYLDEEMGPREEIEYTRTHLSRGNTVLWKSMRGVPTPATVTRIEVVEPGEKYGRSVACVSWKTVAAGMVVVDITHPNGRTGWAYGRRIQPCPKELR